MSDTILILKDNITIRRYLETDADDIAHHANNRKIWRNMTDRFPSPYGPEEARWWINHSNDKAQWLSTIASYDIGPSEDKEPLARRRAESVVPTNYAVCHLDKVIGGCGIEYDFRHPRSVNLGYWLGEAFWGRGIATQVATHFSQWVFDKFARIMRLDGDAYSWNEGSQKVLRKSGFQFEGVQKLRAVKEGKHGDVVLFGKIRPGFEPVLMKTDDP